MVPKFPVRCFERIAVLALSCYAIYSHFFCIFSTYVFYVLYPKQNAGLGGPTTPRGCSEERFGQFHIEFVPNDVFVHHMKRFEDKSLKTLSFVGHSHGQSSQGKG